jgi:hypothetical protein
MMNSILFIGRVTYQMFENFGRVARDPNAPQVPKLWPMAEHDDQAGVFKDPG